MSIRPAPQQPQQHPHVAKVVDVLGQAVDPDAGERAPQRDIGGPSPGAPQQHQRRDQRAQSGYGTGTGGTSLAAPRTRAMSIGAPNRESRRSRRNTQVREALGVSATLVSRADGGKNRLRGTGGTNPTQARPISHHRLDRQPPGPSGGRRNGLRHAGGAELGAWSWSGERSWYGDEPHGGPQPGLDPRQRQLHDHGDRDGARLEHPPCRRDRGRGHVHSQR